VGGYRVEEVRGGRADPELESLARIGLLRSGRAAADDRVGPRLQMEIGFRAHWFDEIHGGLEAIVRSGLLRHRQIAIFRPNAEDDFFAGITGGGPALPVLDLDRSVVDLLKDQPAIL